MTIPSFSIRITLLVDDKPAEERTIPFYRRTLVDHKATRHALDIMQGVVFSILDQHPIGLYGPPAPEPRRDSNGLTAADWGVPEPKE